MSEKPQEWWCDRGCPYYPEPYRLLKVEDHKEEWEALRRQAQEDAQRIARRLMDEFDAQRVWIYGSAAGLWVFHPWSDVDMAVEGPRDYSSAKMERELQGMTKFVLDVRNRRSFRDKDWEELLPKPVLLAERAPP